MTWYILIILLENQLKRTSRYWICISWLEIFQERSSEKSSHFGKFRNNLHRWIQVNSFIREIPNIFTRRKWICVYTNQSNSRSKFHWTALYQHTHVRLSLHPPTSVECGHLSFNWHRLNYHQRTVISQGMRSFQYFATLFRLSARLIVPICCRVILRNFWQSTKCYIL